MCGCIYVRKHSWTNTILCVYIYVCVWFTYIHLSSFHAQEKEFLFSLVITLLGNTAILIIIEDLETAFNGS